MSNKIVAFFFLLMAGAASALGKTGTDPGAPAGVGDFVAGNAAVAAEVNKQINILYKALNDGTNSINIDGWTNGSGNLGYTGGNFGIGLAPTANTRLTVHGTKNTLHQLIGDSASATGAPNTDVFAAVGFYGNGIKHAQVHFRPTLGNGTLVFGGSTSAANVVNVGQSLDMLFSPNGGNVGIGVISLTSGAKLEVGGSAYLNGANGIIDTSLTAEPSLTSTGVVLKATAAKPYMVAKLGTATTGSAFYVTDSSTTSILTVRGDGYVGVGTSSPSSPFEVASTGSVKGITNSQFSSDGQAPLLILRKARGTPAAPTAVLSSDPLGSLAGYGYDGSTFSNGGNIRFYASENWSGTANGTFITFSNTAAGATALSERMRIDDNGRVGIGVTIPGEKLEVGGCIKHNNGTLGTACVSDARLKKDIEDLRYADALAKTLRLSPRRYRYQKDQQGLYLGFIAQEVEAFAPEFVGVRSDGYKTLDYTGIQMLQLQALQELKREKDEQIRALEKRAATADARAAKFERLLAEESNARKQQEIRLARLEQTLQKQVVAQR